MADVSSFLTFGNPDGPPEGREATGALSFASSKLSSVDFTNDGQLGVRLNNAQG